MNKKNISNYSIDWEANTIDTVTRNHPLKFAGMAQKHVKEAWQY